MKHVNLIITLFVSLFVHNLWATAADPHNFSTASWAKGRSCLVCHDLKNDLPRVFPEGSRVVDVTKLTTAEQGAYDNNSHNLSCLVCHQTAHVAIAPRKKTAAASLPPPSFPPDIASGSQGSTHIRVISSGENMSDCLNCHDLHNKLSTKMLKADYE